MSEPDKQQFGDGGDQWGESARNLANAAKELGKEGAKTAASGAAAGIANSSAAVVKAGVEGGKAVSDIAAGGPWGAVLSAAWSLRHTLYKILVCICLFFLILIVLLTSLPTIVTNQVFGLNGADMTNPLTLSQSMTAQTALVRQVIENAHQAALDRVNDLITEGGYDQELSLEALDDQAGDSSYDVAYILCAYSVSMEQLGTSEEDMFRKLSNLADKLFPVTYEVKTAEVQVEPDTSSDNDEESTSSNPPTQTVSYLAATIHPLNQDAILEAFHLNPEAAYGDFSITCGEAITNMATALKLTLYGSNIGVVGGSTGTRRGNEEVAAIALSQVGQVGGYPYWSWYGFSSRVEWCACFVSWCYAQVGLSEPRFSGCTSGGMAWFQSHGQWGDRNYADIAPGDAIFFDWDGSGNADHVGIVVGVDESRVYTVEGNSGNDACNYKSYPLGSSVIRGYGLMLWP